MCTMKVSRKSVWILTDDISRLEKIAKNDGLGFTNTRLAINHVIDQHYKINEAKKVINDISLDTDDCLQQLVDIFN